MQKPPEWVWVYENHCQNITGNQTRLDGNAERSSIQLLLLIKLGEGEGACIILGAYQSWVID